MTKELPQMSAIVIETFVILSLLVIPLGAMVMFASRAEGSLSNERSANDRQEEPRT